MDTYKHPDRSAFSLTLGDRTLEVDITGCDVEYEGKRLRVTSASSVARTRLDESMGWISEHRDKFAEKWVALDGAMLLASGSNAKDVFEQAKHKCTAPLVVRIEGNEMPFGGW